MRLLVLTSTYPRYEGDPQPAFVHELARRLTDWFEVEALAPHAPGLARYEVMDGVRVHRFRYAAERFETLAYDGGMLNRLHRRPLRWFLVPLYMLAMVLKARRLIRRGGHSVIHAHWLVPQGLAALFCRRVGGRRIRVVCTLHGGDVYGLNSWWASWLKRSVLKRLDTVTVVSEAMRGRVGELGREVPQNAVIPMGTDLTSRFTPDPARNREPFLLMVGRLVKKKGADVLLNAFLMLQRKHPQLRLLIVGDGPERLALQDRARRLRIDKHVRFLGSVRNDQLPDLYRRATAAVFPFLAEVSGDQEGFGLVVVEAMGCGCPVVAGDVPAVRDIVIHEATGLLTTPGDPGDLVEKVDRLLANPTYRMALTVKARAHVEQRFDWANTVAAFASLLADQGVGAGR